MSTLSSLKNSGVSVPLPSAQRAAERTGTPFVGEPIVSVAAVMVIVMAGLLVMWLWMGGDFDLFGDKEKDRWVIPAASCVLFVAVNLRE
jgi:hypothetical protein